MFTEKMNTQGLSRILVKANYWPMVDDSFSYWVAFLTCELRVQVYLPEPQPEYHDGRKINELVDDFEMFNIHIIETTRWLDSFIWTSLLSHCEALGRSQSNINVSCNGGKIPVLTHGDLVTPYGIRYLGRLVQVMVCLLFKPLPKSVLN